MKIRNPATWNWLAAWVALTVTMWALFVPGSMGLKTLAIGSSLVLTIGLAASRIWLDSEPTRSVHDLLHDTENPPRRR